VLRNKEHALIPSLFDVFTFELVVESIKELGLHDVIQNVMYALI
jgi:hypothetical protein